MFIYAKQIDTGNVYHAGVVHKHYDMNEWLQNNGIKELIYELHKDNSIHSVWIWKEKTERWGRTATPSSKPDKENISTPPVDKKKLRQDKAMKKSNNNRQPRT